MTVLRITPAASAEETAAVVAVLALLGRPAPHIRPAVMRWARAARLEALGQAQLAAASDPRLRQE